MFRIDPEFKKLIPALSQDEYMQLEQNINADGCREPLTVWDEEKLLLDGHNRLEICKRYGLSYELYFVSLPDRQSAIKWIINNQLGRRNLPPDEASYLRGKRYNMEKKEQGGTGANQHTLQKGQNDLSANTAARLGGEYRVSEKTIKRDGQFNEAVDTVIDIIGDAARTVVGNVPKKDFVDAAEWYKANPGKHPTVEQVADELAGDEDGYDWTDDDTPAVKTNAPAAFVPTTEEEILAAARQIQRKKDAEKKDLIEQKKQEALAVQRATIEVAPTVYQADCVEFLENYPDDHFDLLLTDPPYATDVDDIGAFVKRWVDVALRKVKPTGRAYICTGAYPEEMQAYLGVLLAQSKFIVDAPIIWTYRNTLGVTPKMKYNLNYQVVWHLYSDQSAELDTSITNEMFSVQDINAPDGRVFNRFHTWQKPDELARRLITHATQPGDLIADPFVCTGTFVLMASKLKRNAIGADISADNLAIAKERGCNVVYQ